MKNYLKTREQIAAERLGAVNESVFKIGDVYKVKPIVDIPKSLINAFVSKAKKEQDVDPRENWSDTDIAELMVNYVVATFMNIDSIPVEAIMGDKKPKDITVSEPVQAQPVQPAQTTQLAQNDVQPAQDETKIANIPAQLQVESKKNINESINFVFNNDSKNPGFINNTLSLEDATKIATELNIDREVDSDEADGASFADSNEDILIETNYGISFNPEDETNKEKIQNALIKLGYTVSEEPIESFMINTELTDTIKEHLKENKIAFEKTSGILEIKATKTQLDALKKLF